MRRLPTYAATAALLVGAADGARAQDMDRRASRFDVGVYAGGSLTSNWFESRTVTLNGTDSPVENDDGEGYAPGYAPAFGALANLWLTPTFGIRLHGAYVPMRLPNTESPFTDAGERGSYVMNTYLYDLNLALRPFATRTDAGRWLSSVYLFAGGGGLTTDLAGEDQPLCEGTLVSRGACLSFQPKQATVGQGTAGAGIDLIPLGRNLAVFGEAAVHVYDSPVHVDDAWMGPIRAPSGTRVRLADDAVAVTGRLVIGLKMMFGNLIPPPPVMAPTPPPPRPPVPATPPPPPLPEGRAVQVCVVENGALRNVQVQYNTQSGDTTVNGRRFSEAYPATTGYAAGAAWFINNEPITVNGRRYVKYGLPRVLGVTEVTRTADYMGVPVFAEAGATGATEVLYVPVRPGCEFQPYQLDVKVGGVRGE
ncbi:MAG TPA: hypothetical protein VLK84_24680 [Longimicrobium sp.]|nr:hypothetical protein [Longimicrobium sp.]